MLSSAYEDVHVLKKDMVKAKTTKMQQISSKKIDGFSHAVTAYQAKPNGRSSFQEVTSPSMPISTSSKIIRKTAKPRNLLQEFKQADDKDSLFTTTNKRATMGEDESPSFSKKDLL
jgi:hypothetical protein